MNQLIKNTEEYKRLLQNSTKEVPLEKWGPYLSERQWGTVREDYSAIGAHLNMAPIFQAVFLLKHFAEAVYIRLYFLLIGS